MGPPLKKEENKTFTKLTDVAMIQTPVLAHTNSTAHTYIIYIP